MEPADFDGWATKANLRCSDGRTILPDAFQHQDKTKVPLVWQHAHGEPTNVLGHAVLENRPEGVYCYAYFNDTESGKQGKALVEHGDVTQLSIYANKLVEKAKAVSHGFIREVSLVLAGANPGASIQNVNLAHGDGVVTELEDEAVIYTGIDFVMHSDTDDGESAKEDKVADELEHADGGDTAGDIFDSLNADQQKMVYYLVGQALNSKSGDVAHADSEGDPIDVSEVFKTLTEKQQVVVESLVESALAHADEEGGEEDPTDESDGSEGDKNDGEGEAEHSSTESDSDKTAEGADNKEGNEVVKHNVFEGNGTTGSATGGSGATLSHADLEKIQKRAKRIGSLKDAVEEFLETDEGALAHGITNLEILFPEAKNVTSGPDYIKRRTEWVNGVLTGVRKTPFARFKSQYADITMDQARALGYIKGNLKKEEFFALSQRETGPQTIYKKQSFDRDDLIDITDFDLVAWVKSEMRLMLDEEIARAILIGDGRDAGSPDKIREDKIRPIATDADFYVTKIYNKMVNSADANDIIDALTLNRRHLRGTGTPTMFTSETFLAQMLLNKDNDSGRRRYATVQELATVLRVSDIVTVELLDAPGADTLAILVNLADYTVGSDRGGEVTLFDDFDIDYNKEKYLIETRISGALVKAKSALVVKKAKSTDTLVDPVAPSYNGTNHQVTVATTTGIDYKNRDSNTTLTTGSPVTLAEGDELVVIAVPKSGYYLASNTADEFKYTYADGRVGGPF